MHRSLAVSTFAAGPSPAGTLAALVAAVCACSAPSAHAPRTAPKAPPADPALAMAGALTDGKMTAYIANLDARTPARAGLSEAEAAGLDSLLGAYAPIDDQARAENQFARSIEDLQKQLPQAGGAGRAQSLSDSLAKMDARRRELAKDFVVAYGQNTAEILERHEDEYQAAALALVIKTFTDAKQLAYLGYLAAPADGGGNPAPADPAAQRRAHAAALARAGLSEAEATGLTRLNTAYAEIQGLAEGPKLACQYVDWIGSRHSKEPSAADPKRQQAIADCLARLAALREARLKAFAASYGQAAADVLGRHEDQMQALLKARRDRAAAAPPAPGAPTPSPQGASPVPPATAGTPAPPAPPADPQAIAAAETLTDQKLIAYMDYVRAAPLEASKGAALAQAGLSQAEANGLRLLAEAYLQVHLEDGSVKNSRLNLESARKRIADARAQGRPPDAVDTRWEKSSADEAAGAEARTSERSKAFVATYGQAAAGILGAHWAEYQAAAQDAFTAPAIAAAKTLTEEKILAFFAAAEALRAANQGGLSETDSGAWERARAAALARAGLSQTEYRGLERLQTCFLNSYSLALAGSMGRASEAQHSGAMRSFAATYGQAATDILWPHELDIQAALRADAPPPLAKLPAGGATGR